MCFISLWPGNMKCLERHPLILLRPSLQYISCDADILSGCNLTRVSWIRFNKIDQTCSFYTCPIIFIVSLTLAQRNLDITLIFVDLNRRMFPSFKQLNWLFFF